MKHLASLLVLGAFAGGTYAADLYVPTGQPTIQAAINAAASGDTIHVAAGTYFEHITWNSKSLTLFGAGQGQSIIDGSNNGRCLNVTNVPSGRIEGFTIQHGITTGFATINSNLTANMCTVAYSKGLNGGGMFTNNGFVTLTWCTFIGNTTVRDERVPFPIGGGLFMNSLGSITNCTFSGNSSYIGGGLVVVNRPATVANCTFENNIADPALGYDPNFCAGAGAMITRGGTVTDCSFTGNKMFGNGSGGGMEIFGGPTTSVTDCTFTGNNAGGGGSGGGMNISGGSTKRCTFLGNTAASGGGMSAFAADVLDCSFLGNTATSGDGGGLFNSGGITNATNCIFTSNLAQNGGGFANENDSATVTNCTFFGNSATTNGGGVFSSGTATAVVVNSILWGDNNGEIYGLTDGHGGGDYGNGSTGSTRGSIISPPIALPVGSSSVSFNYVLQTRPNGNGHGNYRSGGGRGSIVSPPIPLPAGHPSVTFNYVLQTRNRGDRDRATLEVNDGSGWTALRGYNVVAESSTWTTSAPVDLTAYAGTTVQLRWRFDQIQGPNDQTPEGWYVDDVRVVEGPTQAYLADFETGAQGFTVEDEGGGKWHLSVGRGNEAGHSNNSSFYYGQGESAPQDRDHATLEVNNGSGWTTLGRYDHVAESSSWTTSAPVDLTAYAGTTVRLRWAFDTMEVGPADGREGWYVDDVRVTAGTSNVYAADFEANTHGFTFEDGGGSQWHLSTGRGNEAGHSNITSMYFGHGETGISPTVFATYSDIQGGFSGLGNINADPIFMDILNGNFRLLAGPSVNSGSNAAVTVATDLDGNARIVGSKVDMGAYEATLVSMIEGLCARVDALVAGGAVLPADGHSLCAKLDSALAKANSGNFNGAIGSLRAFANQVKAFITTHKLTAAQGQPLIDSANALITLLGG